MSKRVRCKCGRINILYGRFDKPCECKRQVEDKDTLVDKACRTTGLNGTGVDSLIKTATFGLF